MTTRPRSARITGVPGVRPPLLDLTPLTSPYEHHLTDPSTSKHPNHTNFWVGATCRAPTSYNSSTAGNDGWSGKLIQVQLDGAEAERQIINSESPVKDSVLEIWGWKPNWVRADRARWKKTWGYRYGTYIAVHNMSNKYVPMYSRSMHARFEWRYSLQCNASGK